MNRSDELRHHGVKGMKWGVRRSKKDRYVSRGEAHLNASKAAAKARKASKASDKASGVSKRKMRKNAHNAAAIARHESYVKDVEHNRQLKVAKRGRVTKSQLRKDARNARTNAKFDSYVKDVENGKVSRYIAINRANSAGRKAAREVLSGPYGKSTYKKRKK